MGLMDSNIGPKKIIEKKKEYLLPCSYHFYKNPPQLVRGQGTKVYDSEGKEYTDFFAGVSVMACGHCNPQVNQRAIDQINRLQHTTSIYLTESVVNLAEKLSQVLPGNLRRSFFCNSGSEANEGAMLLARVATGKRGFLVLEGSLHGRTYLTSGATEISMWRTDPFIDELPIFFAKDKKEALRILQERGAELAGFLVEPIQGNGGIHPLEEDFFTEIGPELKKQNVLLIADEIQTGFGRSGKMFAIEHYGMTPDILTGAKALGNGFPIGFFATNDSIASTFTRPSASTLGGNPVSCEAALGVLDFIEVNGLVFKSAQIGNILKDSLKKLSQKYNFLKSPRGLGLMLGCELGDYRGLKDYELCDYILEEMKNRGFLIGKNGKGRNTLAFQPPLIITKDEVESMIGQLDSIFQEIECKKF